MQNRNDEPRLQHAPLRLPRKDGGRGRVNRRAMGVGRVSEWRKVTSQKPGGNFRQPQSEAEDRTIWPCRDHKRRSSYHRRIFFEVPLMKKPAGKGFQCTKKVKGEPVHVYVLLPGVIEKAQRRSPRGHPSCLSPE